MNAILERNILNGYNRPIPDGMLYFDGLHFVLDTENTMHTSPDPRDMARICGAVQEARRQADDVLISVHSHEFAGTNPAEPAEFLRQFAHDCIDAGADAILGHGPHELRGIEIYKEKPIFYSLGNYWFNSRTLDTGLVEADICRDGLLELRFVPCLQQNCRTSLVTDPVQQQRVFRFLESISANASVDELGVIREK